MSDPTEGPEPHTKLSAFLGDWHAAGTSYGDEEQSPDNPHAGATGRRSIHSARWHSGEYFIVQDERASGPSDTLSLLGWDAEAQPRDLLGVAAGRGMAAPV
ncbi:MAG: hypothetical protein WBP61_07945 [Nocardioides sp.]